MKILFVEVVWVPGRKRLPFFQSLLLSAMSIYPTLQARTYASATPEEHEVYLVNERFDRIDFDGDYDVVHINFVTPVAPRAYEIADIFREKGNRVVMSGLHPSALPDEAIRHADSVLVGRDELMWVKLLDDLEKGKMKKFYHGRRKVNPEDIPKIRVKSKQPLTLVDAVEATRGCVYRCAFCQDSHVCGDFVKRNVDDVIEEIRSSPRKALIFYDLSLTIDVNYTKELFARMKELNKRFACCGNIGVLYRDDELLRLASEAGCVSWLVGFESFNQKNLISVGKGSNRVEMYRDAVKKIHDYGMSVIGSFIFGFDEDDKNVFKESLDKIVSLDIDGADFSILTPLPGTPLFRKLDEEGRIITKDWSLYDKKHVVFKPKKMKENELVEGVRWLAEEFYFPLESMKRTIRCLKIGLYPSLLTLVRAPIGRRTAPRGEMV